LIYSHYLFSCSCIDIVRENRCWLFWGFKGLNIKISALNWRRTKEKYRKKNYQEAQMDQTEEYQHGLYSGKLEKQ